MSVVPPPISIISSPPASVISIPAPMAAASGSSIRYVLWAPAFSLACKTALFSTCVALLGTQINKSGFKRALFTDLSKKYFSIRSVEGKSAMTPSFKGIIAFTFPGVLPTSFFASSPTASISSFKTSTAITDGSLRTTPLLFTKTKTLAVPRSIATLLLTLAIFSPNIF